MPANGALEFLKPYAWLAAIAFLVGFVSYFLLGGASSAVAHEEQRAMPVYSGEASWPTSEEWNVGKQI